MQQTAGQGTLYTEISGKESSNPLQKNIDTLLHGHPGILNQKCINCTNEDGQLGSLVTLFSR